MASDNPFEKICVGMANLAHKLGFAEELVSKTSPCFVYMEREVCEEHYIEIRRWCSREHETTSDLLVRLAEAQQKRPKIAGEILSITFAIMLHQL